MSYQSTHTTDFIKVGVASSTSFTTPSVGTFMIWFYPTSGSDGAIYDSRLDANNIFHLFLLGGAMYAGWVSAGVDYRVVTGVGYPTTGQWNNLLFTWDSGANQTKLYSAGTQVGSTAGAPASPWDTAGADQLFFNDIGGSDAPPSRETYGTFWSRVVTGAEITTLQTCAPKDAAASGRIHEWDMLTDANDSIGSNNGVVSGATLNSGDGPSLPCGAGGYLLVKN